MEQPPQQQRKVSLSLDLDTLIDDTPAAEIVVKPPSAEVSDEETSTFIHGLSELTDYKLEEDIQRKKRLLETSGKNLPDKGAKLRRTIKCFEDELHKRKLNPPPEKVDEEQATTRSNSVGVSNKSRQENLPSRPQEQSCFASSFLKKMEDNPKYTDVHAFSNEMQHFKHRNNQTVLLNRERKRKKRPRPSSRQLPFQCPSKLSRCDTLNDDKRCQANSVLSLRAVTRNLERRFSKDKGASQAIQSDGSRSRKGPPIVLDVDDDGDDDDDKEDDDSEDPHILDKTENKVPEYLKEAKVYFPSRDDPECVEICYNDMECLAPEGFLTSTIMNFYIRYLQQQVSLTILDCHFFNTYFYKKLTEAVSCKESNRETIFAKFRRWWKGVNIFEKAYVLIPIHKDLHWSLIIICIPDKEDESGPIILHLDSLGLHSSKSVFDNIRSYLIEERNYLSRECASSDVPIADRIWKSLSRRIETQVIAVPQQKNEYDCGLFVLYFIERFMEEKPARLKKKDLAMFGKRWFKAEEASNLRVKIRKLLVAELHNSIKPDGITESSPSPSSAGAATDCVETAKDSSIEDGIMSCDSDIIE